jgi:hypothetical protein
VCAASIGEVSTGPLPERIVEELEALKVLLIGLAAEDIPLEQSAAMAAEIGGIRLQLKRIAAEQKATLRELERRALDD